MKHNKVIKSVLCTASAAAAIAMYGLDVFSLTDFSAGESGLINDETTPYTVNITAGGKTVSVVPVGVGLRGDADESGNISLYDAVKISGYLIGKSGEDFEESTGFYWADTNLSGKVDLYDAVNIAKYLITSGNHDERWQKILGA